MANLQVKNIPEELHERLRRHARSRNCSMSAAVLEAIEHELASWEWRERLAIHPTTDLGIDAATLIAEGRDRREAEVA